MKDTAFREQDPYKPPASPLGAGDPDPGTGATQQPDTGRTLLSGVRLMYFAARTNRVAAGFLLLFVLLTGLPGWFRSNEAAWRVLGSRFLISFWVERLVVLPLFALFLVDLGRGLRRLTDEARTAQARLSAGLVLGYVVVRAVLGKSALFEIVDRAAVVLASLLTAVFGLAHVALAYFFTSQRLLNLTRGQDRAKVTAIPGFPPAAGAAGIIGSVVVGLATSMGIFQVTAPLTTAIVYRIVLDNRDNKEPTPHALRSSLPAGNAIAAQS